jgi:hypothetical protein
MKIDLVIVVVSPPPEPENIAAVETVGTSGDEIFKATTRGE